MELLKKLCSIHSPSGEECNMAEFLLKYINENKSSWKVEPTVYSGDNFQDCIILVFGKPKTAVFAHIDSVGFMVRYDNELIKIGSPHPNEDAILVGNDSQGHIECSILHNEENDSIYCNYHRPIDTGCTFTYKPRFKEDGDFIISNYLDNRLGVWNMLQLAKTLKNGVLVFSAWEETGGGSVEFLTKFLYEKYQINKALISDITWVTEGVKAGKGCAISIKDSCTPRRSFVNAIIQLAKESKIPYQLEVESSGGSDGSVIHKSPYPIDWCFVGAAESGVHSNAEKVHKQDIVSMLELYKYLMKKMN